MDQTADQSGKDITYQRNVTSYKYCGVPCCTNTSKTTPYKMFIALPSDIERREKWCRLSSRRDMLRGRCHFCEDHFNLNDDAENLMEYKLTGIQIRMKKDAFPRFYDCQKRSAQYNDKYDGRKKLRRSESATESPINKCPKRNGKYMRIIDDQQSPSPQSQCKATQTLPPLPPTLSEATQTLPCEDLSKSKATQTSEPTQIFECTDWSRTLPSLTYLTWACGPFQNHKKDVEPYLKRPGSSFSNSPVTVPIIDVNEMENCKLVEAIDDVEVVYDSLCCDQVPEDKVPVQHFMDSFLES